MTRTDAEVAAGHTASTVHSHGHILIYTVGFNEYGLICRTKDTEESYTRTVANKYWEQRGREGGREQASRKNTEDQI